MGCDTIVIHKNSLKDDEPFRFPCHLARKRRTYKIIKVIIKDVYDEKAYERLEKRAREIAKAKGAKSIIYMVPYEGSMEYYIEDIEEREKGIEEEALKVTVIGRGRIEVDDVNTEYFVEKVEKAVCNSCPLASFNLVRGILSPPCGFRTFAYNHMMPSLKEVTPLNEIDKLIEEVEAYKPATDEEAREKEALIEHLRKLKKLLPPDEYVLFNWC